MFSVFNTHTPPNMGFRSRKPQTRFQQLPHSGGSLCKHLKRVPVGLNHHIHNGCNVVIRNGIMKQVTHRIHEHPSRRTPAQWFPQLLGHEPNVKALFVGMVFDTPKPLSKYSGIAMRAAGTDFGAASNRVPGCIGPLDFGDETQQVLLRFAWFKSSSPAFGNRTTSFPRRPSFFEVTGVTFTMPSDLSLWITS